MPKLPTPVPATPDPDTSPELFQAETPGAAFGVHCSAEGSVLLCPIAPGVTVAPMWAIAPDEADRLAASVRRFAALARGKGQ